VLGRRSSTAGFSALAAVIVGCALGGAPEALAQGIGSPLSPGIPQSTPSVTTTATPTITNVTTSSSGSSGLSSGSAIAIVVGALVILGGIAIFIWRDARRRAPTRHRAATPAAGNTVSKPRTKPRKLSPAERRRRKRGRAR
jgi:hypothetical protein